MIVKDGPWASFSLKITCAMLLVSWSAFHLMAGSEDWYDRFYQYRIPLTLEFKESGWNAVPLEEQDILREINRLEEMAYDPNWFAYNFVKVVEVDSAGNVIDPNPVFGFHLVALGSELIGSRAATGTEEILEIPVSAGRYYLLSYHSEGGGASPVQRYNPIFPVGSPRCKSANLVSYEPALLPKARTRHERLLLSDGQPLEVDVRTRWVRNLSEISLREARILLLANVRQAGKKNFQLYYQPNSGYFLDTPDLRFDEIPEAKARLAAVGPAERLNGSTRYLLKDDELFETWFAETTVKLTPNTPAPVETSQRVEISTAQNEAQSFQLVVTPKRPFHLKGIRVTDLTKGGDRLSSDNISVLAVDYVPVRKSSQITSTRYQGFIADPLVPLAERRVSIVDGNQAFWITVKTPAETPPGLYEGHLTLEYRPGVATDEAFLKLPIRVRVYDFRLPERSTFRSNLGGQFISWRDEGRRDLLSYHGLKGTKDDLKKLARKYFDFMVENKFTPKAVTQYSEIGMNWTPPPKGYNVSAPGNYFTLSDWDFSEFNRDLRRYIDDLKVNMVTIEHTNPTVANRFKQLPGRELEHLQAQPPHVTMAWQSFRESTLVGYDKTDEDSFTPITREQFDHLSLEYYRKMAENLERNGWLDYAHILVDETWNKDRIEHFLRLLKSDPLTARLKITACMQGFEYFTDRDPVEDSRYTFKGLVDIYMPQLDENYNRWEKYYFTDYGIEADRSRLWNYGVHSSQLVIDTPGVNNRVIGLNVFNRGGSGFLVWETFWWDHNYGESDNPWQDPYTTWGNGALSYFYPPTKCGAPPEPNFSLVPSLRVMTYRESVDDYEYASILEDLVLRAEAKNMDVWNAKAVLKDIERFFRSFVLWSQNDAWYLDLRERIAREIVDLKRRMQGDESDTTGEEGES